MALLTHLPLVHTNTVFSFDKRKQANEFWTGIVKAGGDEGTDDSLRMRISTSKYLYSRHARDEKAKVGILETVM